MKTLMALLFLMSLCSLHLVFSAPVSLDYKTRCCSETTKMRIPVKNIVRYGTTSSDCPVKAIVFETHNKEKKIKKKLCMDPSTPWVKNYLKTQELSAKGSI